ncbi:acyltransferase family protein [Mucilaginibacter xinganensis]|uniref:Peptidoglycan/LPS O-acetylase OafA/YrhL n=1 Tax=Mucilaginibacter xinganensis TaxID=1234841 RepID=A0A223P0R7_9SPHI|nr:acyltransferase [Mucilaginibacter xinganensis]ASU35702.1 Peptidoglycan/LPS O-acetylase OafA/YrhL [Mucilaginibacter xinganensis]
MSAEPHEKSKLFGLDHLRAFAITFVVFFHYQFFGHPGWVNIIASFGWTGVDLFFVLSGFLIAGQLFATVAKGEAIPMRAFFIKRFFRIIPPYLLVLVLYFSFPLLREWGHPSPLWRYLTFTLNFGLDLKQYGTFSHAWSLCVEEQFYLVLPLCFWWCVRFKTGNKIIWVFPALFVAGFVIRLFCWYYLMVPKLGTDAFGAAWNKFIYYPTYNRLDGLLTGVAIAGLFTFYPRVKTHVNQFSNVYMLGGLVLLVPAYFAGTPFQSFSNSIFGFPMVAIAYGIIVAAMICPANILYKAKSVVTSQLATLSYGIYLSHKIVIHVTQAQLTKVGVDRDSNLMMICSMAAVVTGALLMRYLVEKPALRLRDKVLLGRLAKKDVVRPIVSS